MEEKKKKKKNPTHTYLLTRPSVVFVDVMELANLFLRDEQLSTMETLGAIRVLAGFQSNRALLTNLLMEGKSSFLGYLVFKSAQILLDT